VVDKKIEVGLIIDLIQRFKPLTFKVDLKQAKGNKQLKLIIQEIGSSR
jgi:hypothetical protein